MRLVVKLVDFVKRPLGMIFNYVKGGSASTPHIDRYTAW